MTTRAQPVRRRRAGTIYLPVMGVTLIVAVIASTAIAIARLELRSTADGVDRYAARLLACSAVEYAVNQIDQNDDWRSDAINDRYSDPLAFGGGVIRWKLVDSDGDLADGNLDSVELYGRGEVGDAVAVERVTLRASGDPLTCLESGLHTDEAFSLSSGTARSWNYLRSDGVISSNGSITANANYSRIVAAVWAVGSVSGSISGSASAGISPREMPGSDVFDYYRDNGTWIDIESLPENDGKRVITGVVLSPNSNPYGDTNEEGVYLIDCDGEDIQIRWSRIVGTLVLLDNGDGSETAESINWEPAIAGYPALMVEGDFRLGHHQLSLDEADHLVNYNPAHTPHEGASDGDQSDSYASYVGGLIYVAGRLEATVGHSADLNYQPYMDGVTVCDELVVDSSANFNYRSTHFDNPPPGFHDGTSAAIVPGSWRRASAD